MPNMTLDGVCNSTDTTQSPLAAAPSSEMAKEMDMVTVALAFDMEDSLQVIEEARPDISAKPLSLRSNISPRGPVTPPDMPPRPRAALRYSYL